MALFKNGKTKDKLPDLPPLSLPSPLEAKEEPKKEEDKLPSLPAFPSSSTGEKMSRERVKNIIEQPEETEEERETREMPSFRRKAFAAEEIDETAEVIPNLEKGEEVMGGARITPKGQVFIQIDKYEDILRDLEDSLSKVDKIHETIKNVKQAKEEEENEILEWEKELLKVKEDLNRIDQTIFKELR
jgi:hypothetical protein